MFIDFRASGAPSNGRSQGTTGFPSLSAGKSDPVTGGPHPAERCVRTSESVGGTSRSLPEGHAGVTQTWPRPGGHGSGQALKKDPAQVRMEGSLPRELKRGAAGTAADASIRP